MLAHFQELKAQMNKVRECERDKLTKVTLESNAAIKEVKRQKDKVRNDVLCHCLIRELNMPGNLQYMVEQFPWHFA